MPTIKKILKLGKFSRAHRCEYHLIRLVSAWDECKDFEDVVVKNGKVMWWENWFDSEIEKAKECLKKK